MVNVEADALVGPLIHRKAQEVRLKVLLLSETLLAD
jgi:predicted homoserine dehydrogenase-like protein